MFGLGFNHFAANPREIPLTYPLPSDAVLSKALIILLLIHWLLLLALCVGVSGLSCSCGGLVLCTISRISSCLTGGAVALQWLCSCCDVAF